MTYLKISIYGWGNTQKCRVVAWILVSLPSIYSYFPIFCDRIVFLLSPEKADLRHILSQSQIQKCVSLWKKKVQAFPSFVLGRGEGRGPQQQQSPSCPPGSGLQWTRQSNPLPSALLSTRTGADEWRLGHSSDPLTGEKDLLGSQAERLGPREAGPTEEPEGT